ncbi:MAG: hypothetical protein WD768_04245 [Phycisphaeraceae bacterium]
MICSRLPLPLMRRDPLLREAAMLAAAGIRLIDWFQREFSLPKGFCCAHRKLHGRASCSQHARHRPPLLLAES